VEEGLGLVLFKGGKLPPLVTSVFAELGAEEEEPGRRWWGSSSSQSKESEKERSLGAAALRGG
jgi:hypothetical protein